MACWSGERWEEVETDCEDGEVYLVEEEGCVGEWEEGEGVVSNSISFLLTRRYLEATRSTDFKELGSKTTDKVVV